MDVKQGMKDIVTFARCYFKTKYTRGFRTRDELKAWQDRQMRPFLARMLASSPFYREYYRGLDVSGWKSFPVIDKEIMMQNFDRLNTVGIKKEEAFALALKGEETRDFTPSLGGVTIGLSSGTSGNRGLFLVSPQERMMWAASILGKALPGTLFTSQRIAFFLRANSNLYTTVKSRRIQFQFFDLMEHPSRHIERLNRYQPTIIAAPPSMLRLLAETGELRIKPTRIISVAEVLDPLDQAYIASSFSQPVHQIYQCTEGFLAVTCRYGTLHLNEDLLVIQKEYLDSRQGKFMPIITDFSRTTQPIIRYRLNDILTERTSPCPCGSVFTPLVSIEGRSDDLFYLPSVTDKKLVPVFPDFIRRAVILAARDVQEYRIMQDSPQQVSIMLRCPHEKRESAEQAVFCSLQSVLAEIGVYAPDIRFLPYEFQPGITKLRRVERRFSVEKQEGRYSL